MYAGEAIQLQASHRSRPEAGLGCCEVPAAPEVGYRANNALIGHGETIIKPVDCEGRFELDAEAVAVTSARGSGIAAGMKRAPEFLDGRSATTSAREWHHNDRTFWRSKNSDTFKPMGAWIVTDFDLGAAMTQVRVNEQLVAEFKTGEMIFDAIDYIVEIARYITLWPGDVIWMGADGASPMNLGDDVAITITGIGTLRNPVRMQAQS